jgi:hypothetical protein
MDLACFVFGCLILRIRTEKDSSKKKKKKPFPVGGWGQKTPTRNRLFTPKLYTPTTTFSRSSPIVSLFTFKYYYFSFVFYYVLTDTQLKGKY